jgi:hypothetical protein
MRRLVVLLRGLLRRLPILPRDGGTSVTFRADPWLLRAEPDPLGGSRERNRHDS